MISIIVPAYNEEEVIGSFCKELFEVLKGYEEFDFEVIFIDDGSTDNTVIILTEAIKGAEIPAEIVVLGKNYGKSYALSIGFREATGKQIITIDADGQDDPKEIKKLLECMQETKVDVICAYRKIRKDRKSKVLLSKIYNWLNGIVFGLKTHDNGCGLKLLTKETIEGLELREGEHRYINAILQYRGATIEEVEVNHRRRKGGSSKYGIKRIWQGLKDLIYIRATLKREREQQIQNKKRLRIVGTILMIITIALIATAIIKLPHREEINIPLAIILAIITSVMFGRYTIVKIIEKTEEEKRRVKVKIKEKIENKKRQEMEKNKRKKV